MLLTSCLAIRVCVVIQEAGNIPDPSSIEQLSHIDRDLEKIIASTVNGDDTVGGEDVLHGANSVKAYSRHSVSSCDMKMPT
jgi:hypothetical protein